MRARPPDRRPVSTTDVPLLGTGPLGARLLSASSTQRDQRGGLVRRQSGRRQRCQVGGHGCGAGGPGIGWRAGQRRGARRCGVVRTRRPGDRILAGRQQCRQHDSARQEQGQAQGSPERRARHAGQQERPLRRRPLHHDRRRIHRPTSIGRTARAERSRPGCFGATLRRTRRHRVARGCQKLSISECPGRSSHWRAPEGVLPFVQPGVTLAARPWADKMRPHLRRSTRTTSTISYGDGAHKTGSARAGGRASRCRRGARCSASLAYRRPPGHEQASAGGSMQP